jgi:hypothetical protein
MVPVPDLWLPILLSGVGVFIISSIIHMVLPYHKSDFAGLPDEAGIRAALKGFTLPPGEYYLPWAASNAERGSEEWQAKVNEGPNALLTILPNGVPGMGSQLVQWFLYCVVVGACAAYLAGRALGPGAHYLEVFRFVGTGAFFAYSLALLQNSIWYKRKWSSTLKSMFDGFVYALVTAGVFGWLWPGA